MKNLEKLKGAYRLSKNEMGYVVGGRAYSCSCNDGSARWSGNYASAERAASRAAYWCEGGGSCN